MNPSSLGDRLRPFALVLVRTFLFTWLAMVVGGVALAVAAGYWMPNVGPVVRTLLQVFFVLQFVTVGFFVAMRSALAAALIGGVRRMQLGRMALSLLMSRVARDDMEVREDDFDVIDGDVIDGEVIDSASSLPPASRELSAAVAAERLQRVLAVLSLSGRRRGGVFAWLRGALLNTVGAVTLSRFRSKAQRAEKVDLASVERELEDQIDAVLLSRLRMSLLTWTVLVVGALVLQVAAITLLANWLAS